MSKYQPGDLIDSIKFNVKPIALGECRLTDAILVELQVAEPRAASSVEVMHWLLGQMQDGVEVVV